MVVESINDSIMAVKVQFNTNTGTDDLGGSTCVIRFDTTRLSYPSNPVANTNFTFHNFTTGNYNAAFVSRPFPNELWINIDLATNNGGAVVAGGSLWTDVVTLKMRLKFNQQSGSMHFIPTSPFWAIFDGDNSTLWSTGQFNQISNIKDLLEKPMDFSLGQNYPNPFNPTTKIRFSITSESDVKLVIYNLLGELVSILIDSKIAAGNHEITFESDGLPSGTYIYKLEADNKFIASKKMVLLK
jgi:hypothetical protein